ncbi:hypothetical protein ACTXT7_009001 [Hymenolepis weldensis]
MAGSVELRWIVALEARKDLDETIRQTVRLTLDRIVCPCCSPKPHKILMRCTCCGLINPQYKDTIPMTQDIISTQPSSHSRKNDVTPPQHCDCMQNSCRAVKFDVPIESSNKRSDWNQIYFVNEDNKVALDYSPHPTIRHNNVSNKYRTWDHRNCTATAVLVASPKTTHHQEENVRSHRSSRHHTQASPSSDIQMSILPSSRKRRKGQKVTFSSSHSGNRRNRRSVDTALCQQHPLPERYLRVREVEIVEESDSTEHNSNSTEDGDLNSEIDAYSRFLFPCFFILFNCTYWGFYLIISDPSFTDI